MVNPPNPHAISSLLLVDASDAQDADIHPKHRLCCGRDCHRYPEWQDLRKSAQLTTMKSIPKTYNSHTGYQHLKPQDAFPSSDTSGIPNDDSTAWNLHGLHLDI